MSTCNLDTDIENDSDHFSITTDGLSSNDSFKSIPSLNETLISHFSDTLKNFNIVHINAQSIPAHYPEMLTSFDSKNLHAILVSESWLKPCLPSTSYSLPGFHLIRNDRTLRGGGGVAIYLRSHIPFSIIRMSPQSQSGNEAEYLFIEVIFAHTKVLLCVFYSPSLTVDYFSSLEQHLEDLSPLYGHTILMGDFNTCLIKNDSRSIRLRTILEAADMHILPLSATHFFPNCAPSLLDLTCVSSVDHVAKHGQCSADAFSYHDLLYLSYKIRPPKAKSRTLLLRNFSGMDLDKLRNDAAKVDWSQIQRTETVDEQVAVFNSLLVQLFDIHAPVRPVRAKHLPAPWITDQLRALMNKKNSAKRKYKSDPSEYNKAKFKTIRNHCNMVCRDSYRRYIHNSVQNEDPAKVWKFLRSIGIGKKRDDSTSNNLDLNLLNQHFSSSSYINNVDKSNTINFLSTIPIPDIPSFVFNPFTDRDVKSSISSIASNAIGGDSISRKMISPILDLISPVIAHILNFSITSKTVPSSWKDALIIPLPKKSNPKSITEYRPISILPFLSKVLERLVQKQLNTFLSKYNLLNPLQSGFRSGHSTTTALINITDDIRSAMDNQKLTVLTLLDFSNAFTTVDFDILLSTLASLNISPTVLEWFHSYLYGRRQRVQVQDKLSSWTTTCAGVPQGGVLSPLLFSIFINSISNNLTSSYHLYADDLQIYHQASLGELHYAVSAINSDLARIFDWCKSHGLKVNPDKTQTIILGSSRLLSKIDFLQLQPVLLNKEIVPYSQIVKTLGIYFDSSMSWNYQIKEVSRKIFSTVGSFRRFRSFLPIPTKITLAQSLILPILDYADACYLDLTEQQLDKLERLQNICIRFIFGLRKYDHISEHRKLLKWLPIRLRRNTHILSLLYCILFNPIMPVYLKDRFKFLSLSHDRTLRSSKNLTLLTPSHSTSFYSNSFSVVSVKLWNSLPQNIRNAQTLMNFKKLIKEHYLNL